MQLALGTLVVALFLVTLVATTVSKYKVSLSAQAFWICVAAVYFPVVPRLYVQTVGLSPRRLYQAFVEVGQRDTWRLVLSVRIKALYLFTVVIFLVSLGGFYARETGFTSLIMFGSQFRDRALPAVRSEPHYIHENTSSYDGAVLRAARP